METPLKRARIRRNLTQLAVADATGIRQGYFSRLENGEAPSPETAAKLAAYFGGELTELEILYPERYAENPEVSAA